MDTSSFQAVHLLQHTAGVDSHRTRSRHRTSVAVASRRSMPLHSIVTFSRRDSSSPARCLVYVRRIDASSPSTRTYLRLPSITASQSRRPPPRLFSSVSRRVASPPRHFGSVSRQPLCCLASVSGCLWSEFSFIGGGAQTPSSTRCKVDPSSYGGGVWMLCREGA
ncbi:Phox-associated domain [Striga asiatica]|uniref:Phox-associated domain n=1 Tax=Striga asiatica TaxID=4170 RepID=A0A5A7Q8K7_STRAF|nr:Phox-associated domain [Striga asiatica]